MESPYRSFWLEQAGVALRGSVEPLRGRRACDVCIVGGGYVGLWTAITVKRVEPHARVILLEGAECGTGASGRNGGFVMSWWSKYSTLAKLVGVDEALRLCRTSAAVPSDLETFLAERRADAGMTRAGWMWTASSAAQGRPWEGLIGELADAGELPFMAVPVEDIRSRTGSTAMLRGVFESTCATVQPALLARHLRSAALDLGVELHEHSPMTGLQADEPPLVHTPHGSVRAGRVVLALGAWTGRHLPELRRSIIVVASDMVATARGADRLDALGMERGLAISDSRLMVNYFHRTADDRIAFGTAGGALAFGQRVDGRFQGASPRAAEVMTSLDRLYPDLGLRVAYNWTGPVDRSVSGIPFVLRHGRGGRVLAAAGFSGNGVGPSKVVARILCSLALGREDEWADSRLVVNSLRGFPPEPFRSLGGSLVRRAVARKERAEDAGGHAGPVTRRFAALAPAGLVPTDDS
jgi:glycine/D-amino acid oxidase-like deaminating enzyme